VAPWLTEKKNGKPSLDWLSVHHNYIKTRRARAAIQHYFRHQNRDETLAHGREMLDKELDRMHLADVNIEHLAKELNLQDADTMYFKLADGSLRLGKVSMAAAEMLHPEQHGKSDQKELFEVKKDQNSAGNTRFIDHSKVQKGVAANCCLPIPGDDVLGFITKTSGISVHRGDCANIINLQEKEPARVIDVDWYSHAEQTYPMSVQIEAFDRKGLLTDITNVFSSEHVNVVEMLTKTNMQDQSVLMTVTAELPNFERMSQIINRLMQLPNISEVRRKK